MYSLIFTKHADRLLQKMDPGINKKIYRALQNIKSDPYHYSEPLARPKGAEPLYKCRIGDFRAIFAIRDEKMIVLVVDVGPRKTIYKKYGGGG